MTGTETSHLFIGGAWIRSASDETIDVFNPTTEECVGAVPAGAAADVDAAVAAARGAFPSWSSTPVAERAAALRRIAHALSERQEELARLAAIDIGTPISFGRVMHARVPATTFASMADNIERLELVQGEDRLQVVREPVGVVGCITPWNYPLHQLAAKVAPALAAGCTVVVKPSEVAPFTAWALAEVVSAAGVPAGVVNLVSGPGPSIGEALARHPEVDMISFTGSVRAGARVAELAAEGIKRVTLELGGKSAAVVLDDVDDLASVADATVASACSNSGQTCSALTRLVVPRDRLAEVEELAGQAAARRRVGDPQEEDTELGPVVSETQLDRIRGYIAKGVDEGARLVTGGLERPSAVDRGYFVAATVFTDVAPEMTIAQEEIFGPVLSILGYEGEDEAVEIANGTQYGLSGAVWSANVHRAEEVARRLRTGQVRINGAPFNPVAPFGGYRRSGIGRELGPWGLEEFFETKALVF